METNAAEIRPAAEVLPFRDEDLTSDGIPLWHVMNKGSRTYGLKQLYPSPTDIVRSQAASVDIIASHGLDAESPKTWFAWRDPNDPSSGNVHWLGDRHMLPSVIPDSRILTYDWNANYTSEASTDQFLGHADTLLDSLTLDRKILKRENRPIIFIASCFSGLLICKTLVRTRLHPVSKQEDYQRIMMCTVGIATLGTPFGGSWEFGYANAQVRIRSALASGSGSRPELELVQYLRNNRRKDKIDGGRPSPLDELVQHFTEIMNYPKWKIPMVCVYETRETDFNNIIARLPDDLKKELPTGSDLIVSEDHACLGIAERFSIDARHNMLHKFNSPQDVGFKRLSARIAGFARDANRTMNNKDHEEWKDTRAPSREIAQWLQAPEYYPAQKSHFSRVHPGTGTRVLNSGEFRRWVSGTNNTMLCSGRPGVGKTTLSSLVIEQLEQRRRQADPIGVAYIYGDFKSQSPAILDTSGTVDIMLASLLKQLLLQCPPTLLNLSKIFPDLDFSRNWDRVKFPTLEQVKHGLQQTMPVFTQVFIIVDALDEYPQDQIDPLLTGLFAIQSVHPCNIFMTSRSFSNYHLPFENPQVYEVEGDDDDISRYLKDNIKDRSRVGNHVSRASPEIQSELVKAIKQNSEGVFLLAYLHLDNLKSKYRPADVNATLGQLRNNQEQGIETKLFDSHLETVQRVQRQDAWRLALRVLTWVTFSRRVMTLVELQHALAMDGSDPNAASNPENFYQDIDFEGICCGFIRLFQPSGETRASDATKARLHSPIRASHATTQRFLEDNLYRVTNYRDPMVSDSGAAAAFRQAAENELTTACVTYLCSDEFETGPCHDVERWLTRIEENHLFKYAADFWGHHARSYPLTRGSPTWLPVLRFLNRDRCVAAASEAQLYDLTTGKLNRWPNLLNVSDGRPNLKRLPIDSRGEGTALHLATFFGLKSVVEQLLEDGHETILRDELGIQPMGYAAGAGDCEIVQLLLNYGADPDTSGYETSALLFAAQNNYSDVLDILSRGAQYDRTENDRPTQEEERTEERVRGSLRKVVRNIRDAIRGQR